MADDEISLLLTQESLSAAASTLGQFDVIALGYRAVKKVWDLGGGVGYRVKGVLSREAREKECPLCHKTGGAKYLIDDDEHWFHCKVASCVDCAQKSE